MQYEYIRYETAGLLEFGNIQTKADLDKMYLYYQFSILLISDVSGVLIQTYFQGFYVTQTNKS